MDKRIKGLLADVRGFFDQLNDDGMNVSFISIYGGETALTASVTTNDGDKTEYTLYTESGRFTKTTEVIDLD